MFKVSRRVYTPNMQQEKEIFNAIKLIPFQLLPMK